MNHFIIIIGYDAVPEDQKIELIIPYEIDGYSVKELRDLSSQSDIDYYSLNTVINIELPKGLEIIGENAFERCDNLISISIPNTVTTIGDSAFWGCNNLTSITIPSSVTTIGSSVFYWCYRLTDISVAPGNTAYVDVEGVLYNKDKTKIIRYPSSKEGTEYIILDGVTTIAGDAFLEAHNLMHVTIPYGVTTINSAFSHSNITSMTIPNSVTEITSYAFYFGPDLTTVNYRGTQEEWDAITIGSNNSNLTNATLVLNYTGE